MERRFDTIKRSSNNIDRQSLAQRLAEIHELRKLVRKAEAKRRRERRTALSTASRSFEVQENA
jgi:DNA-binding HxlR family transcriptional regulator